MTVQLGSPGGDGSTDETPSKIISSSGDTLAEAFTKVDSEASQSKAVLKLPDGRNFHLNCMTPSVGEECVIDVRSLYSQGKVLMYDPGFNSVAACPSAITYIDGDQGICRYRGYDVVNLVGRHSYMDVSYLLLYGQLPTDTQREEFLSKFKSELLIHTRLKEFITTFVPGAHPMSILSSVLAAMASFYADPMEFRHMDDPEARDLACIRLIAKIPTVVAMAYKVLIGEPMVYPRADLSYAENFLYMMFASPTTAYQINELHAEIIDAFLVIHADHEQNASTSTVRTAGSSLANPYACIASGVTSLWGRAHGGANEAVVDMLVKIGTPDKVDLFLEQVKRREVRLMGFGHRVYKNYDPRAKIMQRLCHKIFQSSSITDPIFQVARRLEETALRDSYFIERKLYPNVDFYSGTVMRALGIPKELFTVLFAMGRCVGWLAHWKEMVEAGQIKITRPRQLYLGPMAREVPTRERDTCQEPTDEMAAATSDESNNKTAADDQSVTHVMKQIYKEMPLRKVSADVTPGLSSSSTGATPIWKRPGDTSCDKWPEYRSRSTNKLSDPPPNSVFGSSSDDLIEHLTEYV